MLLIPQRVLGAVVWIILVSTFRITNSLRVPRNVPISFGNPSTRPDPNSCTNTPDPTGGTCKPMSQCGFFFDTLRGGSFSSEFLQTLRRSICRYEGGTPIICCPNSNEEETTTKSSTTQGTTSTTTSTTTTTTTPKPRASTTTPPPEKLIQTTVSQPEVEVTNPPPVLRGASLLPEECGKRIATTTRITGGKPAEKGSWPWIATLGYRISGQLDFLCGATILTTNHILTAAHCLDNRDDLEVVRIGEHDLSLPDEVEHEDYGVANRIMHQDYNPSSFENDIAIILLDRTISFKNSIGPLCLPQSSFFINNDLAGINAFVAGWGAIRFNSVSSNVLKEAMVKIRMNDFCDKAYENFTNIIVDSRRLCAGEGGNDACQGDSGGPLMAFDPTTRQYTLVGIVSVGYKCADPKFPGIYTRVTEYIDWVIEHLN